MLVTSCWRDCLPQTSPAYAQKRDRQELAGGSGNGWNQQNEQVDEVRLADVLTQTAEGAQPGRARFLDEVGQRVRRRLGEEARHAPGQDGDGEERQLTAALEGAG